MKKLVKTTLYAHKLLFSVLIVLALMLGVSLFSKWRDAPTASFGVPPSQLLENKSASPLFAHLLKAEREMQRRSNATTLPSGKIKPLLLRDPANLPAMPNGTDLFAVGG